MTASTTWKETIGSDEEARFTRFAETLRDLQRGRTKGDHADRALHAKAQAGVEAELVIRDDLPAHLRVGLFSTPARYRTYVRFSNGSGSRQSDHKGDVRGVAIKVLGVDGKKVIPGMENAKTQDFLLIATPTTPFRTPDEFMVVVTAITNPLLTLPRLVGGLGLSRTLQILPRLVKGVSVRVSSLATTTYYTAAPIRFGDYAAHLSLAPRAAKSTDELPSPSPTFLADELAKRLKIGAVVYDLRAQLYVDEAKTPIEDGSVEWRAEDTPFITLATLTLPGQDLSLPRAHRIAAFVEALSFDPWHALEAHRPLGSMMRARNYAYRFSTQERGAAPEPDGSESFD